MASQSMPRYAKMLAEGMRERGHEVSVWQPSPLFFNKLLPDSLKKWFGYIDQYIVFPIKTRRRIKQIPPETLFIFADNALGPWVPIVKNRSHFIHCHDFLAQRSALGEFPQNRVSLSGRLYQFFIRRGYRQGKNFISVSHKTRSDLHKFLKTTPSFSEVVYNGINPGFRSIDPDLARKSLSQKLNIDLSDGYILHVGGNQWYKNRTGVIEIYNQFQNLTNSRFSLILIGLEPSDVIKLTHTLSPFKENIHFIKEADDSILNCAYSGAFVFLFPSIAEGFGWPIAEAMACGCPVITTNETPMTEVGGKSTFFIPSKPVKNKKKIDEWALVAAKVLINVTKLTDTERQQTIQQGLVNIRRFNADLFLNQIENMYMNHLNQKKIS